MNEEKNSPITASSPITRKKFLRVCGAIAAGGAVAAVSGTLMRRALTSPGGGAPSGSVAAAADGLRRAQGEAFASPYRLVAAFATEQAVESLALRGDELYVAAANDVAAYDRYGTLLRRFAADEPVRDMAVADDGIYLLHPNRVSVYSPSGERLRSWEACSDLSDYCSLALAAGCVFATDVRNKNICKYTAEGNFVKFIDSPNGFVIPSYTFGIENVGGELYCSNPGRHQVERYTVEGEYLGAFGRRGVAPGMFTGCCNPVHLSCTPGGDVVTSEKGDPRISCYGRDGAFRGVLLDGKMLGGGRIAYDVKVQGDKIVVAGKKRVAIFRYDSTRTANTACGGCGVSCPLRG
ncbi:MAG: hypothetical protein LBO71_04470 [Prevotellaceae bacterium]|jgi:hypothetical protein|nr:hypothetical protein [Prevotellaceae bacterium]